MLLLRSHLIERERRVDRDHREHGMVGVARQLRAMQALPQAYAFLSRVPVRRLLALRAVPLGFLLGLDFRRPLAAFVPARSGGGKLRYVNPGPLSVHDLLQEEGSLARPRPVPLNSPPAAASLS